MDHDPLAEFRAILPKDNLLLRDAAPTATASGV
jgi:hypothetical protein